MDESEPQAAEQRTDDRDDADQDERRQQAETEGYGGLDPDRIELSKNLAFSLTRLMMAMDESEPLDDAEVADAVGELVNMVGGNIKSLMPGPSALTLPVVAASFVDTSSIQFDYVMAAGVITALPPFLLALVFQRFIVGGLSSGAVKG